MKAIVFDRDGTLVEFVNFLHKIEDVRINKDIISTLKYITSLNYLIIFLHPHHLQ